VVKMEVRYHHTPHPPGKRFCYVCKTLKSIKRMMLVWNDTVNNHVWVCNPKRMKEGEIPCLPSRPVGINRE